MSLPLSNTLQREKDVAGRREVSCEVGRWPEAGVGWNSAKRVDVGRIQLQEL